MLQEERHEKILAYLEENGSITTSIVQRLFSVGYGTAKNDLDTLGARGLLRRTHGGALPIQQIGANPGIHALSSAERCAEEIPGYTALAKAAVETIEANDVLYLTPASIGYRIAEELVRPTNNKPCTVVTNSLTIANKLRGKNGIRVLLTGGEMAENGNFYDTFACDTLSKLRFDKAFITGAACSADFGLSVQTANSVPLTKIVLQNARQVIALFPSAKIGQESIMQICPITSVDRLLTNADVPEVACDKIRESGVRVELVNG